MDQSFLPSTQTPHTLVILTLCYKDIIAQQALWSVASCVLSVGSCNIFRLLNASLNLLFLSLSLRHPFALWTPVMSFGHSDFMVVCFCSIYSFSSSLSSSPVDPISLCYRPWSCFIYSILCAFSILTATYMWPDQALAFRHHEAAHDVAVSCSFEKHYQMSNCRKRSEHHGKESHWLVFFSVIGRLGKDEAVSWWQEKRKI